MKKVYLGLGSNLGERIELLKEAIRMIGETAGKVTAISSLYETEPVGLEKGGDFLNIVLCLETNLSPSGLLGRILMIESKLGRVRCETRYTSRTIDIDILLYNNEIIEKEALSIPHPRLHQRKFVLIPLNELAPDLVHPVFGKTIKELLESCRDSSKVTLFKDYLSLSPSPKREGL
jgi:2-amino-4-hydroxy-6-hydroxymethyldihydropteridine diphosphokinase